MSVIVLGMEMPKVCITEDGWYHSCPMDRTWCAQRFAPKGLTNVQLFESQECKIPDWCPLRPLPEKHGRLVDVGALDTAFTGFRFNDDGTLRHWDDRKNWCLHGSEVENLITDAPTIVEAEGD